MASPDDILIAKSDDLDIKLQVHQLNGPKNDRVLGGCQTRWLVGIMDDVPHGAWVAAILEFSAQSSLEVLVSHLLTLLTIHRQPVAQEICGI